MRCGQTVMLDGSIPLCGGEDCAPRDTGTPPRRTLATRRALAVLAIAAVIALTGAKCGGGSHGGLPAHSKTYWVGQYTGSYLVFGRQKPPGQWEQVGWVRRPAGSRLPRVRVWVQK